MSPALFGVLLLWCSCSLAACYLLKEEEKKQRVQVRFALTWRTVAAFLRLLHVDADAVETAVARRRADARAGALLAGGERGAPRTMAELPLGPRRPPTVHCNNTTHKHIGIKSENNEQQRTFNNMMPTYAYELNEPSSRVR